jgi:2-(1,2-epoxy-1,2-dihydrophenyl)acetyl-CoA isomerase
MGPEDATTDPVTFALDDGLARITFNRPDSGNSIRPDQSRALLEAAVRCYSDSAVRAVLLTGKGKNFCVGGDLKTFKGAGPGVGALIKETTAYLHAACSTLARMDAPLVIAVQGAAAGAGLSLAMLGDIVYAADSAKFTMAYTAAGLSPDGGSTFLLPRLVGLRRAQELTLTNRRLSAAEAVEWGIATAVVAEGELFAKAEETARGLAKGPTRAFGRARRLLIDSFDTSFETQMEKEGAGIAASAVEPDAQDGLDAFLNKRSPVFTGRA